MSRRVLRMSKKFVERTKKFLKLGGQKLDLFEIIWLFAPIAIWFSFHPIISFGQNDTMHFKLSVTLIYSVILALVGLPKIWHSRYILIRSRAVWLMSIFLIWNGMSLFWTANLLRGLFTFGIVGIIYLIFLAAISERKKILRITPSLIRIFIAMAAVMSVFAITQMFMGIWLSQSVTLLCNGCVAEQFGFVRPDGFTIEPQFLGSLLIVPALILLWQTLRQKNDWRTNSIFILITSVLFVTMSRGAIFALGAGAIVLLVQMFYIKKLRKVLVGAGLIISSLLLALSLQGFTAAINPNFNTTFLGAISKSLNQLSMGVIRINVSSGTSESKINTGENIVTSGVENSTENANERSTPNFDGYVEESTSIRLWLSELAIKTWAENSTTMVVGVGIGGAGVAMNNSFPNEIGAREIVQNEFIEILLERGVVGAIIFATLTVGLIYKLRRQKWLWAIIAAFLVQWNFFSGYPSALHIYLAFIVIFVVSDSKLLRTTAK